MVPFPNLPRNVYPVFLVKSTVTAKETRLNKKQIGISPGFAYTEYKVQGAIVKGSTYKPVPTALQVALMGCSA